jgi:hypothetical protein
MEISQRDALQFLTEMDHTQILTVGNQSYSTHEIFPVKPHLLPAPPILDVNTLSGLVTYLDRDFDDLTKKMETGFCVHVVSYDCVKIVSQITGTQNQRFTYLSASPKGLRQFTFGNYYDHEDFIIAMQSLFVQDDVTAAILKLIGNIKDENVGQYDDDGITQKVTARAGISLSESVPVINPVVLAPYRTFLEIQQPYSNFILRLKPGKPLPQIALFEADGGRWKLEAITRIENYLIAELSKEITIIA